ncbi:hypothetical protein [Metabacillus fastidiosus]|uniref:Uncharacterized protein n=1 Tax=Metabacillus fastidiosus TaxID=1458 RepID=A0ABU6NU83_9BACI|nr:hypothetical protein [Metabacillus fastidiosus]
MIWSIVFFMVVQIFVNYQTNKKIENLQKDLMRYRGEKYLEEKKNK